MTWGLARLPPHRMHRSSLASRLELQLSLSLLLLVHAAVSDDVVDAESAADMTAPL